jgi:hypothetical protein
VFPAGSLAGKMASWGADLQKYEQEKRGSFQPAQTEQYKPYNGFKSKQQRFTAEREFDVIRAEFRNPTSEHALQAKEQRKRDFVSTRSLNISKTYDTPYNVVTGQHKSGYPAPVEPYRRPADVYEAPAAAASATHRNQQQQQQQQQQQTLTAADLDIYDIVSGRYVYQDHEVAMENKTQKQRESARAKFLKAYPFDPVRVQWNDPQKEEVWKATDTQNKKNKTIKQLSNLPARVRLSEGMLYNILSLDERTGAYLLADQRAILEQKKQTPPLTALQQYEQRVHAEGKRRSDLSQSRKFNRINQDRRNVSNDVLLQRKSSSTSEKPVYNSKGQRKLQAPRGAPPNRNKDTSSFDNLGFGYTKAKTIADQTATPYQARQAQVPPYQETLMHGGKYNPTYSVVSSQKPVPKQQQQQTKKKKKKTNLSASGLEPSSKRGNTGFVKVKPVPVTSLW